MISREKLNLTFLNVILVCTLFSINDFEQLYENQRFKLGFSTSFDYCISKINYAVENSIKNLSSMMLKKINHGD
jgi:hypothetical protein